MFLRNQFPGSGRWGIPLVRKQEIDLRDVDLLACTNTALPDNENFDKGVHFFVDDFRFLDIYDCPERTLAKFRQYKFCCSPDCSVYGEMQPWRQFESVAHSRWIGAFWQSNGMSVVPTITWDDWQSFEFCFDGVEPGCIVAVATYACHKNRAGFMRGYREMMARIRPDAVICYGEPFPEMTGQIVAVRAKNPRESHRELTARPTNFRKKTGQKGGIHS